MSRRHPEKPRKARKSHPKKKKQVTAFTKGIDRGPFHLTRGVPARMLQRLSFVVNKITATTVPASSVRFNPNAAYDVDPTLGSPSMAYFIEWSSFYGFYRVKGFGWKLSAISLETAKPSRAQLVLANADPGTTMGSAWGGYAFTQSRELGINSGPSKTVFKGYKAVPAVLGSDTAYSADSYKATTAAIPADLLWLGIGVTTIDGSNFAGGCAITGEIFLDIEFYDRLYNGLTYEDYTHLKAKHFSEFIKKRQMFKAAQGQELCPCTPHISVESIYQQQQQQVFVVNHPKGDKKVADQ